MRCVTTAMFEMAVSELGVACWWDPVQTFISDIPVAREKTFV